MVNQGSSYTYKDKLRGSVYELLCFHYTVEHSYLLVIEKISLYLILCLFILKLLINIIGIYKFILLEWPCQVHPLKPFLSCFVDLSR